MRFINLLVILLLCCGTTALAQQGADKLDITIDTESAEAICRLLHARKVDTTLIAQAADLYGNRLLIRKVQGYSGFGKDAFVASLKELAETGTIKKADPYNWKVVKAQLPQIEALLQYIRSNRVTFLQQIKALIIPFTPAGLEAKAKACFLVGGGSLGFTTGSDPTFNVALQKIGNDVQGLQYLVAHELYHTLQDAGQHTRQIRPDTTVTYPVKATYYLLYNLWAEGTANFVGDLSKSTSGKAFTVEQKAVYRKNADRSRTNFQLFETLLYRQYHDTTARYSDLYNIAFTTAFDETAYAAGYDICRQLATHLGDSSVAALLLKDPLEFTTAYIALYKAHPDDPSFFRFSSSVEAIIAALEPWKGRI